MQWRRILETHLSLNTKKRASNGEYMRKIIASMSGGIVADVPVLVLRHDARKSVVDFIIEAISGLRCTVLRAQRCSALVAALRRIQSHLLCSGFQPSCATVNWPSMYMRQGNSPPEDGAPD